MRQSKTVGGLFKLRYGHKARFTRDEILRTIFFVILMICAPNALAANAWRPADETSSKALVNCLIGDWLGSAAYRRNAVRFEIHIRIAHDQEKDYATPSSFESSTRLQKSRQFFCRKGRQRDYYTRLMTNGTLVFSNGKPPAANGETDGSAFAIMPVYANGSILAIYVAGGPWSSRKSKDGRDCVYDATSIAFRNYFRNNMDSFSFIGERVVWVADVGLPNCMEEFAPEYFPARRHASRRKAQAK